jgi:hypothetical protein
MAERKPPSTSVETQVLLASRRRCCICYGLRRDLNIKQGQLAHINRDPSDSTADNLAFMCLEHHDWFDSKPSQSKGPTVGEAKHYRDALYKDLLRRDEAEAASPSVTPASALPAVAMSEPSPKFEPIEVIDQWLNLRWFIRARPAQWLEIQDPGRTLVPRAVLDILDGPYHAATGCNERLEEYSPFGGGAPSLGERCPGCGAPTFQPVERGLESRHVDASTVRAQALAELQRMSRNGTPIEGPRIVLERPLYWEKMR